MADNLEQIGAWKVRDCHTGEMWAVELWGYRLSPTAKFSDYEIRNICVDDGDGIAHVKQTFQKRKPMGEVDRHIVRIGGYFADGKKLVCEAERIPEGWELGTFTGPSERIYFGGGSGLTADPAAQAAFDYQIQNTHRDISAGRSKGKRQKAKKA